MTSPIPGVIAWPVMAVLIAIMVGRWVLVADTRVDHLINRAFVGGISCQLLRESDLQNLAVRLLPAVDSGEVVNTMRQASYGCVLIAIAAIYGFARIWAGEDPADNVRRQWIYDAVAIFCGVTILVAGTPARQHNLLIDQYMGWEAVVVVLAFYAPLGFVAVDLARTCLRELRVSVGDVTGREKAAFAAVVALAGALVVNSVFTPLLTVWQVATNTPSGDPEMTRKAVMHFVIMVGAALMAAVPLVGTIIRRSGWDRPSRYRRQLRPLWADLTAAVPEVVMARPPHIAGRSDSATRLHRTVVEIRDALLHLKAYSTTGLDLPAGQAGSPAVFEGYAHRVRDAIDAKNRGSVPEGPRGTRGELRDVPRDPAGELNQLRNLARVWRHLSRTTRETCSTGREVH